jgi:glycosyltransferase involved in cell wall biosynthesis
MTIPVTAVIITLNEENNIQKCLESVAFCAERLVVDSGSTDRTVEIARQLGARIIHQQWLGFGRQKQFAVTQASHDWVLCLDADEWLSTQLADSIGQLFKSGPEGKLYQFARRDYFLGRWLNHGGYPEYSPRLFHRQFARWSDAMVHETVVTEERAKTLQGDLMHYTSESLGHSVEKRARYGSMQARDMYARGSRPRLTKLMFSPLARFLKLYLVKQGFRDGIAGFVLASLSGFFCFYKYAMLYELDAQSGQERGRE